MSYIETSMDPRIERHVREINRCNQRGGRMLSILDLLDAGTLDRDMATSLIAMMLDGKSFLVGARPGGAGKTTVMGAFLNFIPDIEIVPTENSQVIEQGLDDSQRKCYVAHEIGSGSWYAYIWGQDVSNFLELADTHMIAGNLHADTVEDVLTASGIRQDNITQLELLIFLKMERGFGSTIRRINTIYENMGRDGPDAFKPIYTWREEDDDFEKIGDPSMVETSELRSAEELLDRIVGNELRKIEEVRALALEYLDEEK